jgi:ABC-type sugar transport system substrate-binding protein
MKRLFQAILLPMPLLLVASCSPPPSNNTAPGGATPNSTSTPSTVSSPPPPATTSGAKPRIKIGYVLQVLNDFTGVIKRGAEDAGKALDVDVEVVGPSAPDANAAIGMFEGMVQKKKDGLVVIPMPGAVWIKPIQEATSAGIPVVTANTTSEGSASQAWFGQDEHQSGVILATEMRKLLEAAGKKNGTVLAGICAPGDAALEARYKGLKEGLAGSGFTVTDEKDVGIENTKNYSAWENQTTANPGMVAAVGLCSMDIPNLAKVKTRSHGTWLVGGYDLNPETLDAIKAGTAQVTLGQHPYLQGYLPVLALVRNLRDKKPMPKGWVNVGTEIVTKANVDTVVPRETDRPTETKWYADYISKTFADMEKIAKPLPTMHP